MSWSIKLAESLIRKIKKLSCVLESILIRCDYYLHRDDCLQHRLHLLFAHDDHFPLLYFWCIAMAASKKKKCRVVTATQTTSPQPWPAGQCSKTKIHFFLLCSISVLVVFHNFTVVPLGIKVECVCQTDAHKHTCTKSWQSLWHHHSCLLSPNKLQNTIWTSAWLGFSTSYTGGKTFTFRLCILSMPLMPRETINLSIKLASAPLVLTRNAASATESSLYWIHFSFLRKPRTNADDCWLWQLLMGAAVIHNVRMAVIEIFC